MKPFDVKPFDVIAPLLWYLLWNFLNRIGDRVRTILSWFGLKVEYTCAWGTFSRRYDSIDRMMGRPIHKYMSVAPPWAQMKIVAINK